MAEKREGPRTVKRTGAKNDAQRVSQGTRRDDMLEIWGEKTKGEASWRRENTQREEGGLSRIIKRAEDGI